MPDPARRWRERRGREDDPALIATDLRAAASPFATLLAVDLGVRTGLAVYGRDGRLVSYRSQNFGSAARLRRAVPAWLDAHPSAARLVIEGGGALAPIWEREADRRAIRVRHVSAERWRDLLLLQREQRTGEQAKHTADLLARRVIEWSGAPRPTSLRHDAAEAVLVGLWGVIDAGWRAGVPAEGRGARGVGRG